MINAILRDGRFAVCLFACCLVSVAFGKVFDPRDFGAVGNGTNDDTRAIQQAIDAAFAANGSVAFAPGEYLTGELHLRHGSCLRGEPCNRYNYFLEKPVVRLRMRKDETSRCLLNISGARGTRMTGLDLVGPGRTCPRQVHGVLLDHEKYGPCHDSPVIDSCFIREFSGDGCHFYQIFVFTFRFTTISGCGGNGVWMRGWDGFMTDCTLAGNRGAGFYSPNGASCTFTGNRVEWNREGGIRMFGNSFHNVTGNYFDRCGTAGLVLDRCKRMTVTGNVFYRCGKKEWSGADGSAGLRMAGCTGVTVVGNVCSWGVDDTRQGLPSPDVGFLLVSNRECVVSGNTLNEGAVKELIADRGGSENCVVKDNPGSLVSAGSLRWQRLPDLLVCDRASAEVRIYDSRQPMAEKDACLWRWRPAEDQSLPGDVRQTLAADLVECRPSADGREIRVLGGRGWAIVDRRSRRAVACGMSGGRGLAIERIDDGCVAVASQGEKGAVELFRLAADGTPARRMQVMAFKSPNGLFWDGAKQELWVLDAAGLHVRAVERRDGGVALGGGSDFPVPDAEAGRDLMPSREYRFVAVPTANRIRFFDLDGRAWKQENTLEVSGLTCYDPASIFSAVAIRGGKDGASDTVWLERDGGVSVFRTLPGAAFMRARWIDPD